MPNPSRVSSILQNLLIVVHGLIIVLALGHNYLTIPAILEFLGRTHPLILHFPIVLLLLLALLLWNPNLSLLSDRRFSENLFLLTLLLTGFTVIAGLLLAAEDGYIQEEFKIHKWTGIGLFWLASIWYICWKKEKYLLSQVMSALSAICIIITGHLGASLTHGEDFLFGPLLKNNKTVQVEFEEAQSFDHVIKPILEQKCVSCHKASKQKGDLRLDDLHYVLAGGKHGPAIDTFQKEESILLQRIFLPLDDEEHMPPKGKNQLTDVEVKLIESWIEESETLDKKLVNFQEEGTFFQLAKGLFSEEKEKEYNFNFASTATIKRLNDDYRIVQAIYPNTPALRVSFFGKAQYDHKKLKDLDKIRMQMVELNLSNMPLSEEDIKKMVDFENLEKINLNFTGINGAYLSRLTSLNHLKSLSLTGNPIEEDYISEIGQLIQLEHLYLWETGLSQEKIIELQSLLPTTKIETGFDDEGAIFQLNPPFIKADKSVFRDNLEVTLRHPIGSVNIFYTIDNTLPDSSNYTLYEGPFTIQSNTTLRARAFSKGWLGSEENSKVFLKAGTIPHHYTLAYPPHNNYKGQGVSTLFDLEKGDEDFYSGKWLGFQETPCEIIMEFEEEKKLNSIALSLLTAEASYIFPPKEIEIWVKSQKGNWKKIHSEKPTQPEKNNPRKMFLLEYSLENHEISQLKAILRPVNSIPKWHPGSGEKGWVFIDEVLIN